VTSVDVVVVSYNSEAYLRGCVEPLSVLPDVSVTVVDNASTDGSVASVADLPIAVTPLDRNLGFAAGCNAGWRGGNAPYVLFLNPDARIDAESLMRLVGTAVQSTSTAAVAPKILNADGSLDYSQRRFPRLRSTYAQALFLHRLFRTAEWTDELVRDDRAYERPGSPEWVSGACLLVRRSVLERLNGLDEGFFLYCEDLDLCRRIRGLELDVCFEPRAVVVHEGGASAPRAELLPVLATSRARYASLHQPRPVALLERGGIALGALTHALVCRGGLRARRGYVRAIRAAVR
jgi:GT2 family glycosyltransferase